MSKQPLIAGVAVLLLGLPFAAMQCSYEAKHPQVVLQDDGVTPPNSCLPTACLETLKHPHSHVMLVRYVSGEGHAYCLWTEHRRLFASDWRGTAELFPETGGVMGIARALPVPYDGLVVESAFIMPDIDL